ncbi:hypothetical protein [Bacillus pinisoli]|uniref:hypothetical protein n=1 Tax=Bacillus pinisoli TaxID=2901866 RepID=UPI001FF498B4|nr:hypothetical protein [Bacillus pinisoli]
MNSFFQTIGGRKLIEGEIPSIRKALANIAHELKRANDLKEFELLQNKQQLNH